MSTAELEPIQMIPQQYVPRFVDTYIQHYGAHLGAESRRALRPLHDPNVDPLPKIRTKRPLFPAQAHVVTAVVKALEPLKSVLVCGEMGVGKSIVAATAVDFHASQSGQFAVRGGHAYRCIVMCPGQLTTKWAREIAESTPNAGVVTITSWRDIITAHQKIGRRRPSKPTFYIISRDRVKLGAQWKPVYKMGDRDPLPCCPTCGKPLKDEKDRPVDVAKLKANRTFCHNVTEDGEGNPRICGAHLWSYTSDLQRWEPAKYIHKHMQGFFDYLIADECFPAGTKIAVPGGAVDIESIRPGDYVMARTPGIKVVPRRVLRVIRRKRTIGLVKIVFSKGELVLTKGHKVYSNGGLKRADKLKPGDGICFARSADADNKQGLRGMRQCVSDMEASTPGAADVRQALWGQAGVVKAESDWQDADGGHENLPRMRPGVRVRRVSAGAEGQVLWQAVCGQGQMEVFGLPQEALCENAEEVRKTEGRGVGENEAPESAAGSSIGHRGDVCVSAGQVVLRDSGRQRLHHAAAAKAGGQDWPADGAFDTDRDQEVAGGGSRSGRHGIEAGNRDRRWIAPHPEAEEPRCQEDADSSQPGVVGAAVLEFPDRRQGEADGSGSTDWRGTTAVVRRVESVDGRAVEYVYDLEVEACHNYFANGVLVSNCHEEKSKSSAQANALGALIASTKYHLALSGTMAGGYADHLRTLLFRLCPQKMVERGYTWKGETDFIRDYGRIETTIRTTNGGSTGNSSSRGSKVDKKERPRPGIMPTMFGDLLMDRCVFLGLAEISDNLPVLEERVFGVDMNPEQAAEYQRIEEELSKVVREMVAKGDRRLLASMLQCLLCWPDHPFDWKDAVGYWDKPRKGVPFEPLSKAKIMAMAKEKGATPAQLEALAKFLDEEREGKSTNRGCFVPVVYPQNLPHATKYPKEEKLLELVREELKTGRQCWVFVQYTGKKDVAKRLHSLFEIAGIKSKILPASVKPEAREEWITKHGRDVQVMISHPMLVQTGLDLFDKNGGHNFVTLIFYETGYNTFTLRQASRRSWRIGQKKRCKVYYLYYNGTMQSQAMELMGKKLTASLALEGKFSSEGLAAMGADDGSVEMALAKKLANLEHADDGQTARAWEKIQGDVQADSSLAEAIEANEQKAKQHRPSDGMSALDALNEMEEFLKSLTAKKKTE